MWIKICGIRDVESARQVARLQPDAIGLNFYRKSPRCITPALARQIVQTMPTTVETVGLFVNATMEEMAAACADSRFGILQLHGDEPPDLLAGLRRAVPDRTLIRAHRVGPEGLSSLGDYLHSCGRLGVTIRACLLDARVAGMYGGSGRSAPWEIVSSQYQRELWPPLILAGGLTADNVAEAIKTVRPWGVDVSSGVESSPGVKDMDQVAAFIDRARAAFDDVSPASPPGA